ncbi:ribonuclease H-like domain-containing protein [Candidatus Microgenomates bacterium]|nr:ribonuclease H-like domain-containing protein [Candidatus Microgenomates bacterium]
MHRLPVVFDIETKHTFRDFNEHKKLGVSVVASYDFATGKTQTFLEDELNVLFRLFENASYLIGYNINSFDLPVLQAYYPGDITIFKTFDILDDIKERIGRRLALNDVISATCGKKKSGHGLMAIDYYKEGKWEELKAYCIDDTMYTKELFDYGVKNGEIFYLNENGKVPIKVKWGKYMEDPGIIETPLALPF